MDFDLSRPQKLLKDSAREFFSRQCKPERVRELMATETADDRQLWQAMADQGWTGLIITERFGGLGLGVLEAAVVAEEMGRACLPGPFISNLFASALIESAASDKQKAKYLESIANGGIKATVAQLEEKVSWDLNAIKLLAERDNGTLSISGRKLFVPDAATADLVICIATDDEGPVILPVGKTTEG